VGVLLHWAKTLSSLKLQQFGLRARILYGSINHVRLPALNLSGKQLARPSSAVQLLAKRSPEQSGWPNQIQQMPFMDAAT